MSIVRVPRRPATSKRHPVSLRDAGSGTRDVASCWCVLQGVGCSVHPHWDKTLYHPDDLPYGLYGTGKAAGGSGGGGGGKTGTAVQLGSQVSVLLSCRRAFP